VDFKETLGAVVQTDTLRILLAHTLQDDLTAHQYEVENAYLNAPIEEKMYIQAPATVSTKERNVLRLKKNNSRLKQTAHCWDNVLAASLAKCGLKPSSADPVLVYQ
jgi:hypothetical protein